MTDTFDTTTDADADTALDAPEAEAEQVDASLADATDLASAEVAESLSTDDTPVDEAGDEAVVDAEDLLDEEAEEAAGPVESPYDRPGRWFVVHTYAGYENKVKSNLASRVRSMNMEERIFEVVIPMEDVIEFKAGRKTVVP
ncbi:MAG TPA: transcription termination/antitermination NusG family protein, partial [Acidimicrobiales bacterium]